FASMAVMDTSQTTIIPAVSSWIERYCDNRQRSQNEESRGGRRSEELSPAKVARRGANLLGIDLSHEDAEKWGNRVHYAPSLNPGNP
ncbi:MAG TPA: hypothetical protein VF960_03480, partial [Chloroflexota bacterium]